MTNIVFLNNKDEVGKPSLVYHLAWMLAEKGCRVLAVDLDPQAKLTSMFLDGDRFEALYPEEGMPQSIMAGIRPMLEGTGDIAPPCLETIRENLHLLPGDIGLSQFEASLSSSWPRCLDGDPVAFRVSTALYRIVHDAAQKLEADVVLTDVGPNLGAINRSALIAADCLVIPLAPDLYSLQGLRNLGPTLKNWREGWQERLDRKPAHMDIPLPSSDLRPLGYIVIKYAECMNRATRAYGRWMRGIPETYRRFIVGPAESESSGGEEQQDPNQIGLFLHYRSLMQMAQEARKPIFLLRPADGAIGAHAQAASKSYRAFWDLAKAVLQRAGVSHEVP